MKKNTSLTLLQEFENEKHSEKDMTEERTGEEFKDSEAQQEREGERFFISMHQIKIINETGHLINIIL